MSNWKRIAMMLLGGAVNQYRGNALRLAAIQGSIGYLKAVQGVRRATITLIVAACCVGLMLAGFMLVHLAAFVLLPGSLQVKAVVLLILGVLYVGVAIGLLRCAMKEQRWLRGSHAHELITRATHLP